MAKVIIVESPAKSKTIEKYLGKDFKVLSSKGHIRDLATTGKGGLGIDVEKEFEPNYIISKDKKEIVASLKKTIKKKDEVYLASDPDREGEAISWHLAQVLGLDIGEKNRIVFNEITKNAVLKAVENPRQINLDLVHSQETRRMLDRIIGFKLSKLLQSKIRSKSAGRVQSVALALIAEREEEIKAFIPEEYWNIELDVIKDNQKFKAKLSKVNQKKPKISNIEEAQVIIEQCNQDYIVKSAEQKLRKKEPKLPFITSTLQQEAATKLNFSSKKTMQVAQKLYEGIKVQTGIEGLITYMRTDSYRLSNEFIDSAFEYIKNEYGKNYVGSVKKVKQDNAQDAHEAIRVSDITRIPSSIKEYLNNDEFKLYELIYARTLASLMAASQFNATSVGIENNSVLFTATGQSLVFDGYLKVYQKFEKTSDELLPLLVENEILDSVSIEKSQHFTEPPLRYSEARLIKELEEKGIGRPSTYAFIVDTLQARDYVELKKSTETSKTKVFFPTEKGLFTNLKLQEFFSSIINVKYTAKLENQLDEIANGEVDYVDELKKFYQDFMPLVDKAYENMEKKDLEFVGEKCPKCGNELVYREGKFGKFISCSTYPECDYTRNELEEPKIEEPCPECGGQLLHKKGRYGNFVGCSNYPTCKYIKSDKPKKEAQLSGKMCPECGKELLVRKSRYGKLFLGCGDFPKCRYIGKVEEE